MKKNLFANYQVKAERNDNQRGDDDYPEYIVLHKGTIGRMVLWRIIRIVVYFWVIGEISDYHDHGGEFPIIFPLTICLIITHFILNFIWRIFIFQWIYKMPYSKELYLYLRKSGITGEHPPTKNQ